jgi:hypothetical protein
MNVTRFRLAHGKAAAAATFPAVTTASSPTGKKARVASGAGGLLTGALALALASTPAVATEQIDLARQADVTFKLLKWDGSGCPREEAKSVERRDGNDMSTLTLAFAHMRGAVEGKGQRLRKDCSVAIQVVYNKGFKISFHEIMLRGGRLFDTGARGTVLTGLTKAADAGDPIYNGRHPIPIDGKPGFAAGAMFTDVNPHTCNEEVVVALNFALILDSGPNGASASAEIFNASHNVLQKPSDPRIRAVPC